MGQHGSENGEYISPTGVKSTMVMCLFLRQFGQEEGEGNLKWPTAVHVVGQFVYVSNEGQGCISVYQTSGQFVTSFGEYGEGERELLGPYGITSDQNGFVYVTDFNNNRVEIY